jgi:hypothetical protein
LKEAFRIAEGVTQRLRLLFPTIAESTRSPTLASRYFCPVVKVRSNLARLRPSRERGYHAADDLMRKKSP